MDIMNTWYGYPDIPVGMIRNGADCETDAINYAKAVVNLQNEDGTPKFARSHSNYDQYPDAHILYRQVLSQMPDNSVTIVSVGFSTNLARLMDTPADEYSPLTGKELVAKKVKELITMAGHTTNVNFHEYNVMKDPAAAKKVFEEWPTKVVTSPFEVGIAIQYPGASIENDFTWAEGGHPMVEAYKAYLPMPYDRPCWDPAALVYAVEGDKWFGVSEPGKISISDGGITTFEVCENGRHRYLTVTPEQAAALTDHIVEIVTRQL
jgi:inosine-uridine nucleoside N-ribohydrolase